MIIEIGRTNIYVFILTEFRDRKFLDQELAIATAFLDFRDKITWTIRNLPEDKSRQN